MAQVSAHRGCLYALSESRRVRDVIMLTDASESLPKLSASSRPPELLLWRRSFPMTAPCLSTSPLCSYSCANSLHFASPFAEPQFGLPARLATATIGQHTLLPPPTVQATRSFADSAHSARLPE